MNKTRSHNSFPGISVQFSREGSEGDLWWVAQCVEYHIAAQARTRLDAQQDLYRMIDCRILMAEGLDTKPFEGIERQVRPNTCLRSRM